MARLLSPEECARVVLAIYEYFNCRPGEVLRENNFLGQSTKMNVRMSDIANGLDYGGERGWFENGPHGSFRITEAGFAEIGKVSGDDPDASSETK